METVSSLSPEITRMVASFTVGLATAVGDGLGFRLGENHGGVLDDDD